MVGLVVAGWSASAKGAPFALAWSAPEGCPSREEIVDATHAKLGESRTEAPPEFFVQGGVVAANGAFIVSLVLRDASGRAVGVRVVRVDRQTCTEIVTPTSVVLAMMIAVALPRIAKLGEPLELTQTPPRPDRAPPAGPAAIAPLDVPPRTTKPFSTARASASRLSLGAAGVASLGILPGAGFGFSLRAFYWPWSMVLVGLEASFEVGGSIRAAGGEVGFQLFSASPRVGLLVVRSSRFELIPTLSARAGLIRTSSGGYAAVLNDTRATMAFGLGVLARVELWRSVFMEGLVDVERILLRDRFQILEENRIHPIHQPSAFGGRLSLGISYEFR